MSQYIAKEIKCASADSSQPDITGLAETNKYCESGKSTVNYHAFFQYDLSGIPKNSKIKSATLKYYVVQAPARVPGRYVCDVTSEWSEETLCWNMLPQFGTQRSEAFPVGTGWQEVDITDLVQLWVNDGLVNNGLALYNTNNYTNSNYRITNRYADNPANATSIVIEWESDLAMKIQESRLVELADEVRRIANTTEQITFSEILTALKAVPTQTTES